MQRGGERQLQRVLEVKTNGSKWKKKRGLKLRMQGKQGQISRVRRLIVEAEFWADWSGKEVKGIKRQRLQ